jgi:hypothetical protein
VKGVIDMTTTTQRFSAALAILLLAACGGSSSSDSTTPPPGTPVQAIVSGAAQSTASGLVVNGITFQTRGAVVTTDDTPAPVTLAGDDDFRTHIRDGMVVRIRGSHDDSGSGRANEIEVHDLLEGAIDDRGPGHVRVGGVDVSFDDSTHFEDNGGRRIGSDDFSSGERVEISGHSDGRGHIRATSIRKSSATELEREVRAWIVSANGSVLDLSFEKGGAPALSVDVSGIVPAPSLAVGDFVEVKTRGAADASGVFAATAIHEEDDFAAGASVRMEIEGIVSSSDANGFIVAGQQVAYTSSTEFVGGTIDDVVPGVKVEAQGTIGSDGVLSASKVKFRPVVRIDANADAVDASASTLSLLGLTVRVTPSTDVRGFSDLASIPAGARIEVRGSPTRDGSAIDAMRIELIDASSNDRAFLRGVVTEKVGTTQLKLLGLTIDTTGASFRSHADAPMSASAFFDAVTPNQTVVKVRWRPYPSSTAVAVDEAELEND